MDRDFGDLQEALETLDIREEVYAAIDTTVDRLADMNRDQLLLGYTSNLTRLPRYASYSYAKLKNAMNPAPGIGNPDYYLTGAFQSRIRAERFGEEIEVASYDEKAPYLEARTGHGNAEEGADLMYGPTVENHNIYVEEDLEPEILDRIEKQLKL